MTDFKDTTNWQKKNASTILYRYNLRGKENEGELEKEPHTLQVLADRLSVIDTTAWSFAVEEQPDTTTGFESREYIKVEGKFDFAHVHAFTLDEMRTSTIDRIEVRIFPAALETLLTASNVERLQRQIIDGHIRYVQDREYFDNASLSAQLCLDHATFNSVVQKIKGSGTVSGVRLKIVADLFQFVHERMMWPPFDAYNYGLLCETYENKKHGSTKARIEELLFEWSIDLTEQQTDDGTIYPRQMESDATASQIMDQKDNNLSDRSIIDLSSDVRQIRARLNLFCNVAIAAVCFFAVSTVVGWFTN